MSTQQSTPSTSGPSGETSTSTPAAPDTATSEASVSQATEAASSTSGPAEKDAAAAPTAAPTAAPAPAPEEAAPDTGPGDEDTGRDAAGDQAPVSSGSAEKPSATDAQDDEDDEGDEGDEGDEEERRRSAEEFAREHDPETHDIDAGADLRQRGDWTADESGGPQVWDADGNLVEGHDPAHPEAGGSSSADTAGGSDGSAGPRTSELDEVRDGGYSVGSAAPLDDGAVPLGHPVKAWEDTKTYVQPGEQGYGDHNPDVWFTDTGAAERAGFHAAG